MKSEKEQLKILKEQIKIVREALKDCNSGKLSDGAALIAIGLTVNPQPPLTKKQIKRSKSLIEMMDKIDRDLGGRKWTTKI